MEKHITLVGILNIVYRALAILGAGVLLFLAAGFGHFMDFLVRNDAIRLYEVPMEVLDIVPIILLVIAAIIFIVSVVGIIGAIGVLEKKEWARIVLLVVSFLSLLRVPLGTILGGYSIWVLMNDETIQLFKSSSAMPIVKSGG